MYIIHRRNEYRGSLILAEKVKNSSVKEILNSRIIKLNGSPLKSLTVQNNETNQTFELEVEGLFVAVGSAPQTDLVKDVVRLEDGYIVTDEEMRTNIKGVYAAGDVRKKTLRQIITACADGAIAATSALEER